MKSASIFSIFFVFIIFLSSCGERGSGNVIKVPRDVSPFSNVTLYGSFRVFIKQDSVQKVEVVADDNIAPIIETVVYNNTLVIDERDNKNIKKATRSDVYISVPSLQNIAIKGSGLISTEGENTFKGDALYLSIKGSGMISIPYEGNSISGSIDGSGQINLSGKANDGNYNISGSGYINASDLILQNSSASIDGSGAIDLTSMKTLNATISGSGHIGYTGSAIVQTKVSGSGSVTQN